MLFLVALVSLTAEHSVKCDSIVCNGLIFHGVYFDREILLENIGRPYNLMIHKYSNTLFFSRTIDNGTEVDFGILACHLEGKTCREIKGVPGGYAIAYDAANDDIYFGGHNGIYKYNFLTKSAEFFSEEGKSIWGMFVRKNFYYIEYPTQELFVYQDDQFVNVAEALDIEIDNFFVSKYDDIYFSNRTALYKVDSSRNTIVLDDNIVVRQITEDGYGDVHICAGDGVYLEDKPYHRVKKVADIHQAFGLTFDEHDAVIYSDRDVIYRLLPSNKSVCFDLINTSTKRVG